MRELFEVRALSELTTAEKEGMKAPSPPYSAERYKCVASWLKEIGLELDRENENGIESSAVSGH
jgi:hypothetical protein